MPKIKKLKEVPGKIKSIKEVKSESDLEENLSKADLEKLSQFINGASEEEIAPVLRAAQNDEQADTARARNIQTPASDIQTEEAQIRGYEAGRHEIYESLSRGGVRIRNGSVYNPSIQQTINLTPTDPMTPANLTDNRIQGQRFIGQENLPREEINNERGNEYESQKRKREAWEGG